MRAFSIVLATILLINPANAEHSQGCNGQIVPIFDNLNLVCSATWQFYGKCLGEEDMWDKWKVTGRTNPVDSFVRPFENASITVIGYELMKLQGGLSVRDQQQNNEMSWFMIGSAIFPQPDAMIWLAPGEKHAKQMWPAGAGQLWPSRERANPGRLTDFIDLHGVCFGGGPIIIFLTIYYMPHSK